MLKHLRDYYLWKDDYLSELPTDPADEIDDEEYWLEVVDRDGENKLLVDDAKNCLKISTSSCSVERFYSAVGLTLTDLRKAMNPETLMMWTGCYYNLNAFQEKIYECFRVNFRNISKKNKTTK